MAIEPTINPAPEDIGTGTGGGADIETPQTPDFTGGAEVLQDGQGGAIVQALQQAMAQQGGEPPVSHTANLAELLDEGTLGELSSDLRAAYEEDLESRAEWEETYTKGLDQLGVKTEERTQPFEDQGVVLSTTQKETLLEFLYENLDRLPSQLSYRDIEEFAAEMINFPQQYKQLWRGRLKTEEAA